MELGKTQIARLVLGYLKNEKCGKAFNEFLTTSQHLKQHAIFAQNGKYFATRVGGLSLEDILEEYSRLSFIIQGRLEQTSYYEDYPKTNVVDQLLYILEHQENGPSLPNDLNATPSESLPGNSIESESIGNISRFISQASEKLELKDKSFDKVDTVNSNHESEAENASKQLDSRMKDIVQRPVEDPSFDRILNELIDPNATNQVINKGSLDVSGPHGSSTPKSGDVSKPINHLQSKKNENQTTDLRKPNSASTPISSSTNSDVIIFNGNLESYVGKTATSTPNLAQQSQIYVANTPGLLMVPSMIAAPNYFIVNGQPNRNLVCENDIMKMPTVILDEGSKTKEPAVQPKKFKTLAPKSEDITVSTVDGDYLALYKNDGKVVITNTVENHTVEPHQAKSSSKSAPRTSLRKKLPRQAKMKKSTTPEKESAKCPSTPPNRGNSKKTTPRSGSHVRTLDFTTPGEDEEKKKKEALCPANRNESQKKQASKSLFKNEKSESGTNKNAKNSPWDAKLRDSIIPKFVPTKSPDTSDDRMDLTEDDEELRNNALLIEQAFKTPVKEPVKDPPRQEEEESASRGMIETRKEVEEELVIEKSMRKPVETEQNNENNEQHHLAETSIMIEETEVYLRNCNAPPRFKKKCNLSNTVVQQYEVEVIMEEKETDCPINRLAKASSSAPTITDSQEPAIFKQKRIVLETPVKNLPKTPGKSVMTPFTMALEEQLHGLDLLSMPTPNLLTTPSFPITPGLTLNSPPHSNRPTDYSTSSSYYQPSDTEQNKSLELMIEECKKLEKKNKEDEEKKKNYKTGEGDDVAGEKVEKLDNIKKIFNENIIGKKNLNLIQQNSPSGSSGSSTSCSSSSSSCSSSSGESDSDYDPSQNEEVPEKKETYCLRNRTPKPAPEKTKKVTATPKTKIKSVAEEMECKRERMISNLKTDEKNNTKQALKNSLLKDRINKLTKKSNSKRRTSRAPMKKTTSKQIEQLSKICEIENEITDDDFALHLSPDEETVNKSAVELNKSKEEIVDKTKSDKESHSDLEAEQLIQGLKERGIHLVHKKSPNKKSKEGVVELTKPMEPKQINLEESKEEPQVPLDLSHNSCDVTFDIQDFKEEHLKLNYSTGRKKSKKLEYDVKNLEKVIKANVYIEVLDTEMERNIMCSPYQEIFSYIPTNVNKSKRKSVKQIEESKKQTKENNCSQRRNSAEGCSKKNFPEAKVIVETEHYSTSSVNKNDSEKTKDLSLIIIGNTTDNETVSVLGAQRVNKTELEERSSPVMKTSDDELMNYAILGSQREENPESPDSFRGKKRKCSFSQEEKSTEKKCKNEKQQALLKKIDVDDFLNKVHGNVTKY